MKKFWKKALVAGLTACMAASLAACGGSSSGSSSSSAPAASGSTGAAAAAEGGAGVIKIGGSGPLTGDNAQYGTAVKQAAEMAVEEVNAKGGVQFELQFEDDMSDQEKADTAYGVLKDGGMQISLLTVTSTPAAAVASSYQEDQIFALTPSASSPAVTANDSGAYGNIFQMCFSDPGQGQGAAAYIAAHPDLGTKVAIIYRNDDNYSTGIYNTFVAEAEADNLEIVYDGAFTGEAANDFSVQLKAAQDAGADLLFLPIYYQPASLILNQAKSMGYAPTFFGVDGMDGILALEGFDKSLAEGVYLLTPFNADAEDELTKTFVENYKARVGEVPNQFAADAYDCIFALAQACENAGITADMSNADICEKLVEQFTTMNFTGLTGTDMTWAASGEISKVPHAMVIKDGAYVGVAD